MASRLKILMSSGSKPFGVNTKIELQNITTTSDNNLI